MFTGFPWLASGYAQVDGPFAGFAPVAGVYGVGWMLALVAALIVQALMPLLPSRGQLDARSGGNAGNGAKRSVARVAVPGGIALALIAAGLLLPLVQWTLPANAPLTVRLLQGNVKQEMKFEEAGMRAAIDQYQQMITSKPADLIVTPETAIPVLAQQLPPQFASAVRNFSDTTGTAIVFGAIGGTITPEGQVIDYTNSLFGVTPGTRDVYRYDKHHLVPFGEFVPWGFRWFVNLMSIPLGDFARGAPVQKPFIVHNQPVVGRHLLRGYFRRGDCAEHPRERHAGRRTGQLDQSRLVRRHDRAGSASADRAHAFAGNRPADAARDQHRHDRRDRRQRQGDRAPDAVHDRLARCDGARHLGQHALCDERQ